PARSAGEAFDHRRSARHGIVAGHRVGGGPPVESARHSRDGTPDGGRARESHHARQGWTLWERVAHLAAAQHRQTGRRRIREPARPKLYGVPGARGGFAMNNPAPALSAGEFEQRFAEINPPFG